MKKVISLLGILFTVATVQISAQCSGCTATSASECGTSCAQDDKVEAKDVQVYYFHATRRCATCEAVEKVTKETVTVNYAEKVSFTSINREEDENKALVKKYKVSGQTLLVIKGDKVINLTSDAFMNARTNPEKFEAKLKEELDKLI